MSGIKDGGSAFPWSSDRAALTVIDEPGMTLRDYFAAKAMSIAWDSLCSDDQPTLAEIAPRAYEIADAMLKEREER